VDICGLASSTLSQVASVISPHRIHQDSIQRVGEAHSIACWALTFLLLLSFLQVCVVGEVFFFEQRETPEAPILFQLKHNIQSKVHSLEYLLK
jgi:hypothetical protein